MITGIRSWIGISSAFAPVVTIAQVSSTSPSSLNQRS
jgi:hypothetical protein